MNSNIIPDPLKDQFFLEDQNIIEQMIKFARLSEDDVVLEIGAGTGNLTREIAKYAGRVITFEIDKKFKKSLSKLPKNVEVHMESAWKYIQLNGKFRKKKEYNKIVSNPPYSFIEPFIHNLTFVDYDKVILLVPLRFLKKTPKWAVFGSFFEAKVLLEVPKESFNPVPKTNSAVIELVKLPDPIGARNVETFLRQYIYQHETQLVKNSLMEGIIKYEKLVNNKEVTKNQARSIISNSKIPKEFLEITPNSEIYSLLGELKSSLRSL